MTFLRFCCIALISLFVASCSSDSADSVLETAGYPTQYTIGPLPYASATGPYTVAMKFSASFTTANPIAVNLVNADLTSHVKTLNVDEGIFSGTTGNLVLLPNSRFLVSTDSRGSVVGADFKVVSAVSNATVGAKVQVAEIQFSQGNLRVQAQNDASCSEVDQVGICRKFDSSTSIATVSNSQTALNQRSFPKFTALYAFGDSQIDSGRRISLSGYPGQPYWKGRHSNGPTSLEYLAAHIGIALDKRVNFAVGGAKTDTANLDTNPLMSNTGMLGQLETFRQQLAGNKADSAALYFVHGGANDFEACGQAKCSVAQIDQMVTNIDSLIRDLYGLGARNIYLVGLYGAGSAVHRKPFNDAIKENLNRFKAEKAGLFYYSDYNELMPILFATTNNTNGFSSGSTETCYTGNIFSGSNDPRARNGVVCNDVHRYVFWDPNRHFTTRAHNVWGALLSDVFK